MRFGYVHKLYVHTLYQDYVTSLLPPYPDRSQETGHGYLKPEMQNLGQPGSVKAKSPLSEFTHEHTKAWGHWP